MKVGVDADEEAAAYVLAATGAAVFLWPWPGLWMCLQA